MSISRSAPPAPVRRKAPAATRDEGTPNAEKRLQVRQGRRTAVTVYASVERTVFTREEAAAIIGTSPVTLWREAKAGKLGHTLVGKRIRFLREDLDRYVRGESPRPGARVGWAVDEKRAERMRRLHAEKRAQG